MIVVVQNLIVNRHLGRAKSTTSLGFFGMQLTNGVTILAHDSTSSIAELNDLRLSLGLVDIRIHLGLNLLQAMMFVLL